MKCEVIFDDRRGPEVVVGNDTTPLGLLIKSDSLAGANNTVAIGQELEVVASKPNKAGSTTNVAEESFPCCTHHYDHHTHNAGLILGAYQKKKKPQQQQQKQQ